MLGIIKNGLFKTQNNKKILTYTNNEGRTISVINPTEEHFKMAGYKEVVFDELPEIKDNQYISIRYHDEGMCIRATYTVEKYAENEGVDFDVN